MLFLESNLRNVLFQFRSDGAANFWNQFYFHIKQESRLYFKDFFEKVLQNFCLFFFNFLNTKHRGENFMINDK